MVKNEESKSSQQLNIERVERQRRLWANRRKRWAAWKRDNQKGSKDSSK
jgi:hypothetical protein|tara:strand:- start:306 stop:452 length:147 start_codon:yes stop_codon:yes gene_type:complete